MKKALFCKPKDNGNYKCELCPHLCLIKPSESGFCRVRHNMEGLFDIPYYGMISAVSLDPIEKKPLLRFKPGSKILSIGGYSCNFRCDWCQNYEISMNEPELKFYSPELMVKYAKLTVVDGNIGLAYTYSEPLIHYEYVLDCAKKIKNAELYNVLVTNGYINIQPLRELLPYIDAMNIDLKGFTVDFYKNIKGGIECVKETIKESVKYCHVEVTMLIISNLNDSEKEIDEAAKWLASINPEIPLHLTRFYPRYKMINEKPTDSQIILNLKDIAMQHLRYVYAL